MPDQQNSQQENNELGQLREGGSYYKPSDKQEPRKRSGVKNLFKRRKKTLGLVVSGVVFIFFAIFISARPLELIGMAHLLKQFHFFSNEETTNSRTQRLWRWARYSPEAKQMRRMGTIRNKWLDRYDGKVDPKTGARIRPGRLETELGVRTRYVRGELVELEIVDPGKARARLDLDRLNSIGLKVDFDAGTIDLRNADFFERRTRQALRSLYQSLGYSKVIAAIKSRPLIRRAGVSWRVLGKIGRRTNESIRDYRRRLREDWRNRNKTGAKEADLKTRKTDKDTPDGERKQGVVDELDGIKPPKDASPLERIRAVKNSIKSKAAKGLIGLGLVCLVDAVSKKAAEFEYYNVQLPLIRMATSVISAEGQLKSTEDIDLHELRLLLDRFHDDETQTSWYNARSIQHQLAKNDPDRSVSGPDIPDSSRFDSAESLEKKFINNISGFPGVGVVCDAVNTAVGQVLSFAIDAIIFSWTEPIKDFFISEALERSGLLDGLARHVAGEEVNVDARGAEFGSNVDFGARLAANDQAILEGARELSDSEELALSEHNRSLIRQDFASSSLLHKLFAKDDPNSAINRLARSIPSATQAFASFNPTRLIGALIPNMNSLTPVNAATIYNYGFPKVGFSVDELQDSRFDNPYANAEYVEASDERFARLNKEYGEKCFGTTVNEDGQISYSDESRRYLSKNDSYFGKDKDFCNDKNNIELLRFRFYLADIATLNSLACYEGDEASCTNLGLGASPADFAATVEDATCPDLEDSRTSPDGSKTIYRLKPPPGGQYVVRGDKSGPVPRPSRQYGSKNLLCALHTAALSFYEKTGGKTHMEVWDLSAGYPHTSHLFTVGADLIATGSKHGADHKNDGGKYDTQTTIDLGKALVDTKLIKDIWWCEPGDGSTAEIRKYANSIGSPVNIKCLKGHDDHFHINVKGPVNPIYCPRGDKFAKSYNKGEDGFNATSGEACDGWR